MERAPWEENIYPWNVAEAARVLRAYSGHQEMNTDNVAEMIAFLELRLKELGPGKMRLPWWERIFGNKEEFEYRHGLGGRPSVPSDTGWTVYHPAPPQDGYIYQPRPKGLRQTIQFGNCLEINGKSTWIGLKRYRDSDGDNRVVMEIQGKYKDSEGTHTRTLDRHLTQKGHVQGIDTRYVVFENMDEEDFDPRPGRQFTLEMVPAEDTDSVGVIEMLYASEEQFAAMRDRNSISLRDRLRD